jgi:hypothetical protein
MLKDLNELDKHFILEITRDSLSRGEEVRRNGINKLTVISVVVLSIIAFSAGISPVFL